MTSSPRTSLLDAARSLVDAARIGTPSTDAASPAAQSFFRAANTASRAEIDDAIRLISGSLDLPDASRAAELGLICGALVERGADPLALAAPLTARLSELLNSGAALLQAAEARLPDGGADEEGAETALESTFQTLESEMPAEAAAWHALRRFWPAGIAVYSLSPAARAAAQPLRAAAGKIRTHHEAGHWLHMILTVLDAEPILAIEPSTATGVLARISGVVDNFQLNTLLMDGLPLKGFFARRRVAARFAETARGEGPQQSDDTVTSVWNLYTWRAVRPDLTLPAPNDTAANAHWIWNEGAPEDVPVFEGRRVILLGPPTYPRSWRNLRMFNLLKAELAIERKLSREEIDGWLKRMAASNSGPE